MRTIWLATMLSMLVGCREDAVLDADGDGTISRDELCHASCLCFDDADDKADCMRRCADLQDPLWLPRCQDAMARCVLEASNDDACTFATLSTCRESQCAQ